MDTTLLVLTIAGICLSLLITTYAFARKMLGKVMAGELLKANQLIDEARPLIKDLMTEAGRARALLRHHKAPTHSAAESEGSEVDVPDWLMSIAQGAGIDVTKVLSGDGAELAKAKGLLDGMKGGGSNAEPANYL